MSKKKKDEYEEIYDNGDDNGIDYSDLDENEDPEEAIEEIRGTIESGDCIYCNGRNTMKYDGSICFVCSKCRRSTHEDIYYRWVAGYSIEFEGDKFYDESYEDVWTEDGDVVNCDELYCNGEIRWRDGQYICPECGQIMSRAVFFNHIGADPPGKECVTCNELYPGCISCPRGYVKDKFD